MGKSYKNGHFISWPGLTPELVRKHSPKVMATKKGHMKQEYKGLYSTKEKFIKK